MLNHQEKCQLMKETFESHRLDELRTNAENAFKAYCEANQAYQEAVKVYHEEYDRIWH